MSTDLTATLRARGHRVTPQRLVIHDAVLGLDRHVTADEVRAAVADRLPNVSVPTVYATLELFEDLGIVRRVHLGSGPALYDPRPDDHHHLVCTRCGAVEDVDSGIDLAPALRAAGRTGFAPDRAEVVVHGLCSNCR